MTTKELLTILTNEYSTANNYNNPILENKINEAKKHIIDFEDKFNHLNKNYVNDILLKPLLNVMDKKTQAIFKHSTAVSLAINSINANVTRVNQSEYLIIINRRLMALIHAWNEIQLLSISNINKNMEIKNYAKLYAPILDCYLNPSSNKTLAIFSFDEIDMETQIMATSKTIMHEQFVLAHELAHIFLNHLEPLRPKDFIIHDLLKNNYYSSDNVKKEFEADVQAVKWLNQLCRKNNVNTLTFYVEALVIFHMIECNTQFPKSNSTHPAAIIRLINISDSCKKYFDNCDYDIDDMIKNCLDIESFRMF